MTVGCFYSVVETVSLSAGTMGSLPTCGMVLETGGGKDDVDDYDGIPFQLE